MATADGSITAPRTISGWRIGGISVQRVDSGGWQAEITIELMDAAGVVDSHITVQNSPVEQVNAMLKPLGTEPWLLGLSGAQKLALSSAWDAQTPAQLAALFSARLKTYVLANTPTFA
jgi:hypothetical protein